jgi:hypothetical protein
MEYNKMMTAGIKYTEPLKVDKKYYKYKEWLDEMGPGFIMTFDQKNDQTELWHKLFTMLPKYGVSESKLNNNFPYIMPYFENNDHLTSDYAGKCIGIQVPESLIGAFLYDYMKDNNTILKIDDSKYSFHGIPDGEDMCNVRELKDKYLNEHTKDNIINNVHHHEENVYTLKKQL